MSYSSHKVGKPVPGVEADAAGALSTFSQAISSSGGAVPWLVGGSDWGGDPCKIAKPSA